MKTLAEIQKQLINISENHFDFVNSILTANGWSSFDIDFDRCYGNVDKEKEANEAKCKLYFAKHIFYKY